MQDLRPGGTLVHSSPQEMDMWHYIDSLRSAKVNFDFFDTQLCFFGHTHKPLAIKKDASDIVSIFHEPTLTLKTDEKYLVNTGSVGQPRDKDTRAVYVIWDSALETISWHRVEYNIRKTQKAMEKEALPHYLIERLNYGR